MEMTADSLKCYALKIDAATGEVVGEYHRQDDGRPDLIIDRLVRAHMARTGEKSYAAALECVKLDPENAAAVEAYGLQGY